MLKRIRKDSPRRRRMGITAAAVLALGIGVAAWAADTEIRETGESDMFSFDFKVTVDGVQEKGTLTITGDEAIVSAEAGETQFLAREQLRFKHESEDSGWSAEFIVTRMPDDERFRVDGRIERDGEIVSTPHAIISGTPAYIKTSDPETGGSTYRLDITPVGVSPAASDGHQGDVMDSAPMTALVSLTVDDTTAVERIEWPRDAGDTAMVLAQSGEPEPWSAQIAVERLDADRIMLCIESIEVGDLAASAGCMMYESRNGENAYMMSSLGESGIPYRLDIVPNMHE